MDKKDFVIQISRRICGELNQIEQGSLLELFFTKKEIGEKNEEKDGKSKSV